MNYIGIDIGSTASKTIIYDGENILNSFTFPTGWSSKDTSELIKQRLLENKIAIDECSIIATGYGRICVDFADKVVTEIKCHAVGAAYLFGGDLTVIDVGGQDTKVITWENGMVTRFTMNDKCSAGTGKFIEIMANRMGVGINEFLELASNGKALNISSMCTVFAESEVISYIGSGTDRRDIAAGVIDSVATKVVSLCERHGVEGRCVLTGGLGTSRYFADMLADKLKCPVNINEYGRYTGAIGAAILASELNK